MTRMGGERADGQNITSSDCVLREGSVSPTSEGEPGRCRNTGLKVKYGVGRPPEERQETSAEQSKGCTKGQKQTAECSGSGRKEQHAQQHQQASARAAAKAGTSLAVTMQLRRGHGACCTPSARKRRRKKWKKSARRKKKKKTELLKRSARPKRSAIWPTTRNWKEETRERMDARRREAEKRMRPRTAP